MGWVGGSMYFLIRIRLRHFFAMVWYEYLKLFAPIQESSCHRCGKATLVPPLCERCDLVLL